MPVGLGQQPSPTSKFLPLPASISPYIFFGNSFFNGNFKHARIWYTVRAWQQRGKEAACIIFQQTTATIPPRRRGCRARSTGAARRFCIGQSTQLHRNQDTGCSVV